MYMPTVARFTARDPLPQNGEPILLLSPYWYANNAPVLLIDPSGLLSINAIPPFKDAKCGEEAVYTWNFELSQIAGEFCGKVGLGKTVVGYFVQRVQIWCRNIACPPKCAGDCPTPPEPLGAPDLVFYEAWEVYRNSKQARVLDDKTGTYTDQFNFDFNKKDQCGYRIAKGEVKFFCKSDTKDLGGVNREGLWKIKPLLVGKNDCDGDAGELPARDEKDGVPGFWPDKEKKFKDGKSAVHTLNVTYNLCKEPGSCVATPSPKPKP